MTKFNLILVASILLTSISCSNKEKKTATSETIKKEVSHSHDEVSEEIELNQGKKWEVVPEMMKIIQEMEQLALQFSGTNLEQYKFLAENLTEKINELTSNCTMQGKAHDELHKWLVPFIDEVSAFSKIKTKEEGAVFLKKIRIAFNIFNTYFI